MNETTENLNDQNQNEYQYYQQQQQQQEQEQQQQQQQISSCDTTEEHGSSQLQHGEEQQNQPEQQEQPEQPEQQQQQQDEQDQRERENTAVFYQHLSQDDQRRLVGVFRDLKEGEINKQRQ